jgi:hypothetical protein
MHYVTVCCEGYGGTGCYAQCSPSCLNGECTSPDNCECLPGWEGPTCATDIDECLIGMLPV